MSLIGRKDLSGEIYRQLRRAMADGRLQPGHRLPASRELARSLGVSHTTVTVAYDRLAGEGFVTSRIGAGTYVGEQVAPAPGDAMKRRGEGALHPQPVWDAIPLSNAFARPAQFDFRTGLPDASLFPHATCRRQIGRELRSPAVGAGVYADPAGHRGLREAIARQIGISRGVEASADDITVTSGAQQALDLVARVLLAPGDRVAVEDPGYWPPRVLFESLGARVHGVPVDHEGLVVDALPRHTRLVYVTPSHQYPLGVAMSLARRFALLAWTGWPVLQDCEVRDTDLIFPREHRLHAFLYLLRRDVLFMRGHPPEMSERILQLARAVAVELVHDGLALFGPGGQRSLEKRIDIFDIEMDADGRSAQRLRRLTAELREFIRQHYQGIAQADFRMAEASVRHH